jgi:multimeric flavodoxin WrbA
MKIIAIVGSIRRGNTYTMVEAGCQQLKDCDVELIHLKDISINICDGCLKCDETATCHIDDDMSDLVQRIKHADGFIFGTPSRWSLLSGELKVFFDRLNPLAVPELLAGKKAIVFAVGQSKGEDIETIKLAAESVKHFCDNAEIEVIDTVIASDCLQPEDLITKHVDILDECRKSADKLFSSLL